MNRLLTISLLFAGLMLALPAYAADGNIYLTGHDLDFHCALQPAPTQCNAFKIALTLARAGAPDPTKPVLFLDQGSQLATAAGKIGLSNTAFQVVDPTTDAFTGDTETSTSPLALDTSSYSAIVFASDTSCGGCDNTSTGEEKINGRTTDIANFFHAGGGLVYLSGATSDIYYSSVPSPYGVARTNTGAQHHYVLTTAGSFLGLTNDDANCCETHNSFVAPSPVLLAAPTFGSASNSNLISAELDSNSKDETLFHAGSRVQQSVLTFTPGNPSQTATFNCASVGCPDPDAHSMKVSVGAVNSTFSIVLTAFEVEGDGNCADPNDTTDYDCRFVKFFGNSSSGTNIKVPFCYPYSHGKCVFYDISGAPPRSAYTSPVLEYIAWNNTVTAPAGYLSTPHMYDDPSDDANNCACYPTTTPGFPYSPEDNQYVFDITTFYKDEQMQVGKDPGTGGKTTTFNQFGIAFPLSPNSQSGGGDAYKWISPLSNTGVTTIKNGSTLPVKFQLRDSTGSIVSNAVIPPNFVRMAILDSTGVSQPIVGTGAFTYDPTKQQYQFNLATSSYPAGTVFTIVVNSNLFSEQIAKFKTSK